MITPSAPPLQTGGSSAAGGSSPGVKAQVRGLADDAKHSAETFAEQRKAEGAERLQGVSETVSRIADDVANESPAMADFVRKAAHGLEGVSRDLKDKSVGDIIDMAKTFARREPAAFLAASAVAGFALSRLLKSSASAPTAHAGPAQGGTPLAGGSPAPASHEPHDMAPPRPDLTPASPGKESEAALAAAGPAVAKSPGAAGGLAPSGPAEQAKPGLRGDAI